MTIAMSAFGTKRTFLIASSMSAFGGKADIEAKLLTKDEARRIAANFAKLGLAQRNGERQTSTLVIMAFGAIRSISIGVC